MAERLAEATPPDLQEMVTRQLTELNCMTVPGPISLQPWKETTRDTGVKWQAWRKLKETVSAHEKSAVFWNRWSLQMPWTACSAIIRRYNRIFDIFCHVQRPVIAHPARRSDNWDSRNGQWGSYKRPADLDSRSTRWNHDHHRREDGPRVGRR